MEVRLSLLQQMEMTSTLLMKQIILQLTLAYPHQQMELLQPIQLVARPKLNLI